MKKYIFIILLLIFLPISIKGKETVTLSKCVDGDTAWFFLNEEKIKTRFLAIDTPESTTKVEAYGKEASEYTCNLLSKAKTIEIEYDENSDKLDKYNRHLVWVFVDGKLLQDLLIEKGLAEVKYLYGDYSYTSLLQDHEKIAKENKVGIWSEEEEIKIAFWYPVIIIIGILLIYILYPKCRKK